ncbi:MAG TPA: lysophospholipid acyltransferase family protein [Thermoanaerobaculales bacterium]|nr:lysophospholipid acyltransferase family protein [Thermoanaerobaculales bacterium]HQL30721.1 lysophospholipid acyltransferase family protein [Thermoanaerobaculales bacterium]HQN95395.1 lysophospholipid acyltransferase family protein [Thermoanaerobaculales bacterium]HQP39354.1 lysophospholipid acyltransferase family protein [Polyangiaceae bacterium]
MKRAWSVPSLGRALPRRESWLLRRPARWALRAWRWRFDGNLPDVAKAVAIVVPHTSNWDFVLGILGVFAVGVQVSFLGKHTLFRPPFGGVMRWLGGIPVDRRSSKGAVEQIVTLFRDREQLVVGLSPEGTRKRVARWRTGFYHIAAGAGCPIVPIAFDWGSRTIRFGEPLLPSGDLDADLEVLRRFFANARGRIDPDRAGTPATA